MSPTILYCSCCHQSCYQKHPCLGRVMYDSMRAFGYAEQNPLGFPHPSGELIGSIVMQVSVWEVHLLSPDNSKH